MNNFIRCATAIVPKGERVAVENLSNYYINLIMVKRVLIEVTRIRQKLVVVINYQAQVLNLMG